MTDKNKPRLRAAADAFAVFPAETPFCKELFVAYIILYEKPRKKCYFFYGVLFLLNFFYVKI